MFFTDTVERRFSVAKNYRNYTGRRKVPKVMVRHFTFGSTLVGKDIVDATKHSYQSTNLAADIQAISI